jgi:hypothetical protein
MGLAVGEFFRVKIQIDISKPLPRGCKLRYKGKSTWILFKYEQLPKFCFQYGVICHGTKGCLKRNALQIRKTLRILDHGCGHPRPQEGGSEVLVDMES